MAATPINPIIPGFAPDPSVVLVDGTFFLVNSTFHMFPGLPIYASKDLIQWEHIGNAFNRREQMSLRHSDVLIVPEGDKGRPIVAAGGLYAPTIRYRDGVFYIVCTNVVHRGKERGIETCPNFIISTTDIWSDQWSDPVPFEFDGIDPSLFWDDDGRVYLQGSKAPGPLTKIHQFEIDVNTGKKLSEEKKIWDGNGADWPEGPHLYKRDGWYYLLIAEGGCWEEHMITVARSRDVWGPYESCPRNPILTAFGEATPIQHIGHSDVFEDAAGRLWAVCLGVRKDQAGRHNLGRETFLTSAQWKEGDWPHLDRIEFNPEGLSPTTSTANLTARPMKDFLYIRDVEWDKYRMLDGGKRAILTACPVDLTHKNDSPTFVGKRQRQLEGETAVTMVLGSEARAGGIKAGLASYKDEHRFLRIFYDSSKGAVVFEAFNSTKSVHVVSEHAVAAAQRLLLRIQYTEQEYRASFAEDQDGDAPRWKLAGVADTGDLTSLDFTGPVNGVFAVGHGQALEAEFQGLCVD